MYTHAIGIELYWPTRKIMYLCEISFAETKKVLLNIILICIYFQHTFTYATTKLVSSTRPGQLVAIFVLNMKLRHVTMHEN